MCFFVMNRIWSMNLRTYLCMLYNAYAINAVLGNCPGKCLCESSNKVQCQDETITEIPSNIPHETINLFISRTRISLFSSLQNLQRLFLSGNKISHLPQELFRGLGELRQLDLSKNALRVIPEGIFDDLSNLESLSLKDNQIEHLPSNLFSSLENLVTLYLSRNNLVRLPEGIFLHVTRLQKLSLFQNRLENLGTSVFGPLLLTELWLYSNNLTRLEDGIFRNLTKLQLLILSRNSICSVSAGAFAGLSDLREVSLHTNRLVSLEEGTFAHLNNLVNISLRCVNLHDNSLYNLHTELLNSLQDTEEIVLSQNPWRCDHDIIPFRNWLQAHWSKVPNLTSVVCQTPLNLSRINIAKLTDKDLGRYKRFLSRAMTLIAVTLISTSVISITFLCCLFRRSLDRKYCLSNFSRDSLTSANVQAPQ
uniref:LRRCT domain-containing protein n=1 Tax=Paramormyrops kingsleyae TaxID=1676925 RepID=A0A3B3RWW5_9TELE